jgi:hypothetical protein
VPLPKTWLLTKLLAPLVRPATRIIIGLIAIPILRLFRNKVLRNKVFDDELEKDVEQWFRASLLLFFATKNVELMISSWLALKFEINLDHWFIVAGRLLLAIGVVESMPDQELFSIIHPGPPKLVWRKGRGLRGNVADQAWPFIKGVLCRHINRSSPVFAILSAIFDQTAGWVFYLIAISQYLFIGLVTSRDKAADALAEFDRKTAQKRRDLVEEFDPEATATQPSTGPLDDPNG